MVILKEGYPFIGCGLAITAFVYYLAGLHVAVVPGAITLFIIFFFRNPNRPVEYNPDLLYSPADGTVMAIEKFFDDEYLNEPATKITIFLSVFSVHVNRSPIDGEIKFQRYTCGHFVPAYEKAATLENERHAIGLDNGRLRILVIQVAGILARRIVSWVTLGHQMQQGECYGMIKFGSSTELVVPENVEILVKKGDAVTGGITVMGRVKRE